MKNVLILLQRIHLTLAKCAQLGDRLTGRPLMEISSSCPPPVTMSCPHPAS